MSTPVRDVTEQSFQADVVAASNARAVVVDFWAPWCGPCRQLSPLLEQMADRYADDVTVVKVNVDEAPNLARTFGVQGIPAVKAFRDGRVVGEFTGLAPTQTVEQFFADLAPSQADRLVVRAAKDPKDAKTLLEQAVALEPAHTDALVALAELARADGRLDDARTLLGRASQHPEAQRMLAALRLSSPNGNGVGLSDALDSDDDTPAGRLVRARALINAGDHADAVEALLLAVADTESRDEARALLLDLFRVLGDDHDLTRQTRPRLASALFS